MRLMTLGVGIAALLASTAAWAATPGGGGAEGGKAGPAPPPPNTAGGAENPESSNPENATLVQLGKTANPDTTNQSAAEKPWSVDADFGTHHLIRDQYIAEGLGPVRTYNVMDLGATYRFTDRDILRLGGGIIQYLEADPGESGFRAFDLALSYTRYIPLPGKVSMSVTGAVTAPISYESQLASNITTPSLSLSFSRTFGDLFINAYVRGTAFWDRYSSTPGLPGSDSADQGNGQMNPQWSFAMGLGAEYAMPFHRPLSIGASVGTFYTWFYNTGNVCPQNAGLSESGIPNETGCPGFTTNPVTDGNPTQQAYGGSGYLRYILPDLAGFRSDFEVGVGSGGPGIGAPSVLQDGVTHLYLLEYNSAEVFATIEGRY
jgi:hypothetical protein